MKKNHLKKLVILFSLVVILALLIFLLKANETTKLREGAEINGLKLVQNSSYGTVKIVSYDKDNKYIKAAEAGKQIDGISNFVIPEEVEIDGKNYYITEIGENAFSNSTAFKTVTIPETVKKIGSGAFTKCSNLEKIVISSPKTLVASDAVDISSLEYNGETLGDPTEFENKIIGTLNSSEVIKFPNLLWGNGKAEVKLLTEYEKYTIQYRVNEGAWTDGTTVSDLNHNDKIEARLAYGETYSKAYASYTVVDAVDPVINSFDYNSYGKDYIEISFDVKDNAEIQKIEIYRDGSLEKSYPLNSTSYSDTYTINGLSSGTGYGIKIVVTDVGGNETEQTEYWSTESGC